MLSFRRQVAAVDGRVLGVGSIRKHLKVIDRYVVEDCRGNAGVARPARRQGHSRSNLGSYLRELAYLREPAASRMKVTELGSKV